MDASLAIDPYDEDETQQRRMGMLYDRCLPGVCCDDFGATLLSRARAFFLSHAHTDHMNGLGSHALHERLRTAASLIRIRCSGHTRRVLENSDKYRHLMPYVDACEMEQPMVIQVPAEGKETAYSLCVTLLPAGHCFGSVMFLFETSSRGNHRRVLFTGDMSL